jgi:Transposase
MTKTQVDSDHIGAETPKLVAGGEGADRCGGHGAGAVASEVARAAGIHTSQLFRWRQQLCERSQVPATFNPVAITPAPEATPLPPVAERTGVIEIEFATGGRMRITGPVDALPVAAPPAPAGPSRARFCSLHLVRNRLICNARNCDWFARKPLIF